MSNINISELLGTVNDNSTSALFSSLSNNSSIKGGPSGIFSEINFTDYASIKNGSYRNVVKKYYSEDHISEKSDIDSYEKMQSKTADKSASLASDINDLMDSDFTDENKEDLIKNIKDVTESYNNVLKDASSSDSKSVRQQAEWMSNMVKGYSKSLEKIGITVASDGSLSVDNDKITKAASADLDNLFGKNVQNLSNKILYKTEQIYSLAKTYGTSATAYTSNGSYKRNYSASNINLTT